MDSTHRFNPVVAAKVASHFHKGAALTCWCRSHRRLRRVSNDHQYRDHWIARN